MLQCEDASRIGKKGKGSRQRRVKVKITRERERERCISRVYENESLRGGKDGVRGYEGVVRGGGGRGEVEVQWRMKVVGVCIADLFPPTHSSWRI